MTKSQFFIDPLTQQNVDRWLNGSYDEETKKNIRQLIQKNPKEIVDAFYTTLSFGTGGLRGIMGVGSNRMNVYTVRAATQGLANYINSNTENPSVFIGYDSRNNSQSFAEEAAKVLAGNDIHVYLCPELRPTPYVSFGVRHKNCQAGITITASHNPAIYNGYKVYWSDGGQVVPPHDQGIIAEVNKITDITMISSAETIEHPHIEYVGAEVDEAYLEAITPLQLYPEENQEHGDKLNITYTSLHGTGITLAPQAFERWGFRNLHFVEEQIIPDGNFPTVKFPNPEEPSALKMGVDAMDENDSDILIANDPDADRVGIVVKHDGENIRLNGNQVACLCLEHICQANKLPKKPAFIKTIVTSELFQAIATKHKVPCFNVLTGFKYIAELIHKWEQEKSGYQFVFGGEESYGYLLGTQTRDKDAIVSSALICEIALHAKQQGKTLIDLMNDIYAKYGVYVEELASLVFEESKSGREKMAKGISQLQTAPPTTIANIKVVTIEDYHRSVKVNLETGETETIELPQSNVLTFWLKDNTKLIVRPSGTEPKIKIYCGVTLEQTSSVDETLLACQKKAKIIIDAFKERFL